MRIPRALAASAFVFSLALGSAFAEGSPAARISDAGPMAWLIEDEDTRIYVLGTVHYGIEGMDTLDEGCLSAFDAARTVYAELSSEDYARAALATTGLLLRSILPKGESLGDKLSQECRNAAIDLLGEVNFKAYARYRPWVLSVALMNAVITRSGLKAVSGIDLLLYKRADGRAILGLDSLESQLELLTYGSDEEQIASLEASVPKFLDGSFVEEIKALVEAYASGDRAEVDRLAAASLAEGVSANPEDAVVYEMLLGARNESWAKILAEELGKAGDIFVFAGVAHFIGEGSVFDEMRALGALR